MPTKEMFEKYVSVQKSGEFNMITEAADAAAAAGLSMKDYFDVIKNYSELDKLYSVHVRTLPRMKANVNR